MLTPYHQNTSRIAVDLFKNTKEKGNSPKHKSDNPIVGFFQNIGDEVKNATDGFEEEIDQAFDHALQSFARTLGLKDFYSIHVMNHCEGFYRPNGTSSRHVTYCSNSTGFSHFNPSQTLAAELKAHKVPVNLQDLHWPKEIDQAVAALKLAFNIMFVLYVIGITAIGLAFIGSILGVFFTGRASALGNIFLTQLAFLALLISSAIITYGATKATNTINKYGKDIDINAARGNRLIAMTWSTVALVFLASMAWVFELVRAKKQEKMTPKQLQ